MKKPGKFWTALLLVRHSFMFWARTVEINYEKSKKVCKISGKLGWYHRITLSTFVNIYISTFMNIISSLTLSIYCFLHTPEHVKREISNADVSGCVTQCYLPYLFSACYRRVFFMQSICPFFYDTSVTVNPKRLGAVLHLSQYFRVNYHWCIIHERTDWWQGKINLK